MKRKYKIRHKRFKINQLKLKSPSIRHQTIAKQDGDFESKNEDSVKIIDTSLLVLSDGAGGTGVEAHRWSRYLVDKTPIKPFKDFQEFSTWLDSIWETYFQEIKTDLEQNQAHALNKFYDEGSSATLAIAWIDPKKRLINAFAYGDSMIFLFQPKKKAFKTNIPKLSTFLQNPMLINSNNPPTADGAFLESWHYEKGDILLVASDTISQYLLTAYFMNSQDPSILDDISQVVSSPYRLGTYVSNIEKTFEKDKLTWDKIIENLWTVLEENTFFKEFTDFLRSTEQLGLDDYSIVFAKL